MFAGKKLISTGELGNWGAGELGSWGSGHGRVARSSSPVPQFPSSRFPVPQFPSSPVSPAPRYSIHVNLPWIVLAVVLQVQTATQTPPPPPALPQPMFTVTVIEAAPLVGVDLPIEKIPAPVQVATSEAIERSGALELSAFLNRRFNGVFVNEIQSNPFQPDINYRGYTASPLLGTPQGLSVYMDGVRLNQPFGDVVSWDLIPRLAISSTTRHARLQSAVRPQHPGWGDRDSDEDRSDEPRARASRRSTEAMYAVPSSWSTAVRKRTGCTGIVAGNLFGEDGWRADSPSDVRQVIRQRSAWQPPETRRGAHLGARRQLA